MIKRLMHLWHTIQSSWDEDPAARGAAKVTLGGFLIWEGVFGTFRGIGEKNSKDGLFGSLVSVGVGIGLVWVVGTVSVASNEITEPRETSGTVIKNQKKDVREDGEMETHYRSIYEYSDHTGTTHRLKGSSTSSTPTDVGTTVGITYDANRPSLAYRSDGIKGALNGNIVTIGYVLASLLILFSFISLVVSVVALVIGFKLFRGGMADRRAADQETSFVSDLLSLFSDIRSDNVNPKTLGIES